MIRGSGILKVLKIEKGFRNAVSGAFFFCLVLLFRLLVTL